jgi:hypothetical protein
MGYALPLNEMTIEEKLKLIEDIWEDMLKNSNDIPTPSWHLEILQAREKKIKEGKANFIDLKDVKKNIRKIIK